MTLPPKNSPTIVSRSLVASGLIPFEAKILLGHVLRRDRAWLAAHGDQPMTAQEAKAFDAADIVLRKAIGEQALALLRSFRKHGTVEQVGLGRGVRWKLAST